MMVIAVGLSSYNVALFHLVNHAFYKALLFLAAGSVIHAVADQQDFRKYGGLRPYLPLTYSVMLIASLSLVAFPFMTGFYSKDFILESAYGLFYFTGTVVYFIATIGAMFTTLYSLKVLYLTFLTNPKGKSAYYITKKITIFEQILIILKPFITKQSTDNESIEKAFLIKQAHEGDLFINLPLIILAIFSIFFGYISKDIFIGLASAFFADNSLFIHFIHEIILDTEFAVTTIFKLLPLVFTISITVLAIIIYEWCPNIIIYFKLSRLGYNIFGLFNKRFFLELLYNKYISGLIYYKLGDQTTMVLDKGSVELLGPFGLEKSLTNLSRNISNLSTGLITDYALFFLIATVLPNFCRSDIPLLNMSCLIILAINIFIIFNSHISLANKYKGLANIKIKKMIYVSSFAAKNYDRCFVPATILNLHGFSSTTARLIARINFSSTPILNTKEEDGRLKEIYYDLEELDEKKKGIIEEKVNQEQKITDLENNINHERVTFQEQQKNLDPCFQTDAYINFRETWFKKLQEERENEVILAKSNLISINEEKAKVENLSDRLRIQQDKIMTAQDNREGDETRSWAGSVDNFSDDEQSNSSQSQTTKEEANPSENPSKEQSNSSENPTNEQSNSSQSQTTKEEANANPGLLKMSIKYIIDSVSGSDNDD